MRQAHDVLLLIVDDLRADLGCYGRRWARTPHIDALSSRSATFLQAHASVANCAPSRASLMTGLRPDTHGVLDLKTHIRDRHHGVVTLPQRFRQAGYLAVSYGKIFHQFLDDAASWSGQDEWPDNHTYRGLRGGAWGRAGGWSRGWRYNQYMLPQHVAAQEATARRRRSGDWSVSVNGAVPPYEVGLGEAAACRGDGRRQRRRGTPACRPEYTDERIARLGVRALRMLMSQPSRRWLLALGFVRPHLPFNVPQQFWDGAVDAQGGASDASDASASDGSVAAATGLSRLTAAHLGGGDGELYDFQTKRRVLAASPHGRALGRAYGAAVSFVDSLVGTVLDAVRARGGDNRTIVALFSDHGWKLGHHGDHWGKHTLMGDDTHVPLLIAVPGWRPRRVHAPVELIDLYPTLLALTRLAPPRGSGAPPLEGQSLVPLMRRRQRAAPRAFLARAAAFSQWPMHTPHRCMGYAVRTQGWLLIQWAADRHQSPPPTDADAASCGAHADLFKVRRNASREGVLREVPTPIARHPHVAASLRRRLWRVLRVRAPDHGG